MSVPGLRVRDAREDETEALATLWLRSAQEAHPYLPMLQALDVEQGRDVFRRHVMPGLELVLAERGGVIVGLLGLEAHCVDRLPRWADQHAWAEDRHSEARFISGRRAAHPAGTFFE